MYNPQCGWQLQWFTQAIAWGNKLDVGKTKQSRMHDVVISLSWPIRDVDNHCT
jgi:hypothetical protein